MNNFDLISQAYFIGIGGIGMSAIARYFKAQGKTVAGYDKTPSPLTRELETSGIEIIYEDDIEALPEWFRADNDHCIAIYTPAIPKELGILEYAKQQQEVIKRSEALARITHGKFTIAVAGTHGKTTTSTYLAYLLASVNKNVTAFLGGISTNFNSNYVRHEAPGDEIVVVEADEYDRSFLRLSPNVSIITSCEPDHLDIYKDYDDLKTTYNHFANRLEPQGKLILHESLDDTFSIREDIDTAYYGFEKGTVAHDVQVAQGSFHFSIAQLGLEQLTNGMPGHHNLLNATAALSATALVSTNVEEAGKALPDFKGIKRRFETIYKSESHTYIDDYAHHPSEIKAAIATARFLFPETALTVVFQPHLFSRTKDFAQEFKKELQEADQLYIMPIYPAREAPIPGVTSEILLGTKGRVATPEEIIQTFTDKAPELLLTLGAGSIDRIVEPLKSLFHQTEQHV